MYSCTYCNTCMLYYIYNNAYILYECVYIRGKHLYRPVKSHAFDQVHTLTRARQTISRILGTGPCFRPLTVRVEATVWNEIAVRIVVSFILFYIRRVRPAQLGNCNINIISTYSVYIY